MPPTHHEHIFYVRDVLEASLPQAVASKVMLEALERFAGGSPDTAEAVADLIGGSLRFALESRVPAALAADLLVRVRDRIAAHADLGGGFDVDLEAQTSTMPVVRMEPVTVTTLAASSRFADRLVTALGPLRVKPSVVADVTGLRHAVFSTMPLLALVDVTDAPAVDEGELAAALRGLPSRVTPVVWGSELPLGGRLSARLREAEVAHVAVSSHDIDALLDLVASRQARE